MDEKEYLSYGTLQVEKQALLNKMADEVSAYVDKLSWTRNKKERFITAYTDLIKRGIIGAYNDTGQWLIEVNGDDLNIDALPKKEKRMYQEAAWFIRHLMESLALNKETDEKKEETSKTPIDFVNDFKKYVSKQRFGGTDFKTSLWNEFDLRDKSGIRGTENRAKILSGLLDSYSLTITDDKYDFKDSAFENATDLKNRIAAARAALETPNKQDDLETFYAIGLDPKDWFNNGSGDLSGYTTSDGLELTYSQYGEYLKQQEKLKIEDYNKKVKEYKASKKLLNLILKSANEVLQLGNRMASGDHASLGYDYNTAGLVADISSFAGDIVSLGGGPAGLAGGLWSLGSDVVGDIAKGKSAGTVLGNVGLNTLWTIAGFIPGARISKLVKRGALLATVVTSLGIAMDEDVLNTWKKIANGDIGNLSNLDIENIKWTAHAITGNINAARSYRSEQKINSKLSNRDVKIRTKNNDNAVTEGVMSLSQREINRINRAGNRGGNAAAQKLFLKIKRTNAELVEEGLFNFGDKGKAWYNPSRYYTRNKEGWLQGSVNEATVRKLLEDAVKRMNSGWHPFRHSSNPGLRHWGLHLNWNSDMSGRETLRYLREKGYDLPSFSKYKQSVSSKESSNNVENLIKTEFPEVKVTNPTLAKLAFDYKKTLIDRSFTNTDPVSGSYKIGDNEIMVIPPGIGTKSYIVTVKKPDGSRVNYTNLTISDVKNKFADSLLLYKQDKKAKFSEMVTAIKELKQLGYLQQGGRIDKLKIQKYKEYILK